MRYAVLGGAGIEGTGIVRDLVNSGVGEVVIADCNVEKAQTLAAELASTRTRVSAAFVDADDHIGMVDVMKKSDVVASALGPFYKYGVKTVRAAIDARVPYVDINDDYDATEAVLELDGEAKAAGIPVIVGLGLTPGLSNVCVKYASDKLDRVHTADIAYIGAAGVGGEAVFLHFFHGLCDSVPVFRGGERVLVSPTREPHKQMTFPAPFGTIDVPIIGHPEPITLPRHMPGIQSVTVRGAVYPRVLQRTIERLAGLGLLSNRPVDLPKTSLSPREFILACFDTHIETPDMLREIEAATGALPSPVYGTLRVDVAGEKDGHPAARRYTISADLCDATDWPASIGAQMLAKGEIDQTGVFCPEQCILPARLFSELKKRKIHIEEIERTVRSL